MVVERKIDLYRERVEALYSEIIRWYDPSEITFKRKPVELEEYPRHPYSVDALQMFADGDDLIGTITPQGANIIGAEGQVLVVGKYDLRYVTYYLDKGPRIDPIRVVNGIVREREPRYLLPDVEGPGWYLITDAKTGATRQLDAELLRDILREVSDYGL